MREEELQLERRVDRRRPDRHPLRAANEDRRVVHAGDRHCQGDGVRGVGPDGRRGAERRARLIDAHRRRLRRARDAGPRGEGEDHDNE